MESLFHIPRNPNSLIFLIFSVTFLFNLNPSSPFSPPDNFLLNCGSPSPATVDHRIFLSDATSDHSFSLSSSPKISLQNPNPNPNSNLYATARIFTKPSSYHFRLKSKGTHLIRLHFSPFNTPRFNLSSSRFHVSALGFTLLNDLRFVDHAPIVKDYIVSADADDLVLSFTPACRSSFAFVSAIEVVSAPPHLVSDAARFVDASGIRDSEGDFTTRALETVYRINVGGKKVTPFNDTLWRTWIPDDEFLFLKSSGKPVFFSGRIKYHLGGATREVVPDNVLNSARVMGDSNMVTPNFNITWIFPVSFGYRYLVRMHFCDIVSLAVNRLYFNVYLNGYMAYEDLDLSAMTNQMLASPYYVDFVVEPKVSGVIRVSVGPSNLSSPSTINAILNGLEIFKVSDSMGSLDGEFMGYSFGESWLNGNVASFLCSILSGFAFVSVLMAVFMLVSKMRTTSKDSVAWSPLPVDVSGDNLKYKNSRSTVKNGYVKI